MADYSWKPDLDLNLEQIDKQHRKFFEMLREADAFAEQAPFSQDQVAKLFRMLVGFRTYGYLHFHTEEKLMLEKNYPQFAEHLDLHDQFIAKLNEFRIRFLDLFKALKGGFEGQQELVDLFKDLLEFVSTWYQQHISNDDSKYAYYMKTKT